jgi:hypothetical protein
MLKTIETMKDLRDGAYFENMTAYQILVVLLSLVIFYVVVMILGYFLWNYSSKIVGIPEINSVLDFFVIWLLLRFLGL